MPRVFLSAEWRNLIIVSYHAPSELLDPHVPDGLELDPIDGAPAVSLVAFQFLNTRVFGVPWPGFVNFPEWNLRFYVRTREPQPRRGVVFIREFVPSRFVSRVARQLYNEPYAAAPMRFAAHTDGPLSIARCEVRFNHADHTLEAIASSALTIPDSSSISHSIKEHRWGFGRTRAGRTLCYEVEHPVWRSHEQPDCRVRVNWSNLYGAEWAVMQGAAPFSTVLAEGSAITVSTGTCL